MHSSQLDADEPFRQLVNRDKPLHTDLGAWNMFANANFPHTQKTLTSLLQAIKPDNDEDRAALLNRSIAAFKTPTVRNLGQSEPYMHDGQFDSIEAVMQFYLDISTLARASKLRNADPRLLAMQISAADIAPLSAFLRSLNEDYH